MPNREPFTFDASFVTRGSLLHNGRQYEDGASFDTQSLPEREVWNLWRFGRIDVKPPVKDEAKAPDRDVVESKPGIVGKIAALFTPKALVPHEPTPTAHDAASDIADAPGPMEPTAPDTQPVSEPEVAHEAATKPAKPHRRRS